MNKLMPRLFVSARSVSVAAAAAWMLASAQAHAQAACTEFTSGLQFPLAVSQSNQGNLIVSEGGPGTPNTGRISIVDASGNRRTLLAGLPSGLSDVGDPAGPAGLFLRGRTLYVAIGAGDVGVLGRDAAGGLVFGSDVPNPSGASSPLFSSILAIHFSADVENTAEAFTLSIADQQALASGRKVTLASGNDHVAIETVANFPDYVPFPHPVVAGNVQLSNPFGIVGVGDHLYVTDGGRNRVWEIDIPTGLISALATFANIPNPFFPALGPPTSQAVPTGITYSEGELMVTLFRGNPFAPGTSTVEAIDPLTGDHAALISGLKTAIGVIPMSSQGDTDYLVLQYSSGAGPFFPGPGLVLRFEEPSQAPALIANCLSFPSAMVRDVKTGTLYVAESKSGRIVSIPIAP
jgi:hypothetical protein